MNTLSVHWHVKVSNWAVCAEDFAEVVLIDVFGELFDHDLGPVLVTVLCEGCRIQVEATVLARLRIEVEQVCCGTG